MSRVTFLSMLLKRPVTVSVPDHALPTLLSVAQGSGVPLPCHCGDGPGGNCGSCAVKVAAVGACCADAVGRLGREEKNTLMRVGKFEPDRTNSVSGDAQAHTPLWRLACQYVLSGEDIWVAF